MPTRSHCGQDYALTVSYNAYTNTGGKRGKDRCKLQGKLLSWTVIQWQRRWGIFPFSPLWNITENWTLELLFKHVKQQTRPVTLYFFNLNFSFSWYLLAYWNIQTYVHLYLPYRIKTKIIGLEKGNIRSIDMREKKKKDYPSSSQALCKSLLAFQSLDQLCNNVITTIHCKSIAHCR